MKAPDDAEFTEFAATTIRRLRRTAYLMCGDWRRASRGLTRLRELLDQTERSAS